MTDQEDREPVHGEETNISEVPLPDVDPDCEFTVGHSHPDEDEAPKAEPPVLTDWEAVDILSIPDDCVTPDGVKIWDLITAGTGLDKHNIQTLQEQYVNSKGEPVELNMIGIGNFTFIIRQITTKLHRQIIDACHTDEQAYKEANKPVDGGSDGQVDIPGNMRQRWEERNTIAAALVWPPMGTEEGQFDPDDDDLPFLLISQLFSKILEVSGAYDIPMVKKV